MTVSIVIPSDDVSVGNYTKVYNHEGKEIENITKINVNIESDCIVSATIEVAINNRSELKNIHAILGTKTLHDIALLHGYNLERIGTVGNPIVKSFIKEDR